MLGPKYKLMRREIIADPFYPSRELKIYRIKALRDILTHQIKKGDIGGYVTDKMTLSQHGECWIADNALVHGASVTGDAIVRGNAIVYAGKETTSQTIKRLLRTMRGIRSSIKLSSLARITLEDKVRVFENAKITAFSVSETYINPVKIKGKASVFGDAHLMSPALVDNTVVISADALIGVKARILEDAHIFGNAVIGEEATIAGSAIVAGNASIGKHSIVLGKLFLSGNVKIAEYTKVTSKDHLYFAKNLLIEPGNKKFNATKTTGSVEEDAINRLLEKTRNRPEIQRTVTELNRRAEQGPRNTAVSEANSSKMDKYKQLLQETLESLNHYETDIVKIIKYPVMVDKTDDYTASMLSAKRAVSLIDPDTESSEFYAAVLAFDKAFHAAEANALRISSSRMNHDEQKKTQKAQDLFSIAVNTASTENEKVNAFKQGLKQLEGIILVPEKAVTALRVKAGIAELEA